MHLRKSLRFAGAFLFTGVSIFTLHEPLLFVPDILAASQRKFF